MASNDVLNWTTWIWVLLEIIIDPIETHSSSLIIDMNQMGWKKKKKKANLNANLSSHCRGLNTIFGIILEILTPSPAQHTAHWILILWCRKEKKKIVLSVKIYKILFIISLLYLSSFVKMIRVCNLRLNQFSNRHCRYFINPIQNR